MNIYELMALPEDEQQRILDAAFKVASSEKIEVLDGYNYYRVLQKLIDLMVRYVDLWEWVSGGEIPSKHEQKFTSLLIDKFKAQLRSVADEFCIDFDEIHKNTTDYQNGVKFSYHTAKYSNMGFGIITTMIRSWEHMHGVHDWFNTPRDMQFDWNHAIYMLSTMLNGITRGVTVDRTK